MVRQRNRLPLEIGQQQSPGSRLDLAGTLACVVTASPALWNDVQADSVTCEAFFTINTVQHTDTVRKAFTLEQNADFTIAISHPQSQRRLRIPATLVAVDPPGNSGQTARMPFRRNIAILEVILDDASRSSFHHLF